jgi:hypothetical protein
VLVLLAGVGALPVFGIAHGQIRWTSAYDIYASGRLRKVVTAARSHEPPADGLKTGHIVRTMRLTSRLLSRGFARHP